MPGLVEYYNKMMGNSADDKFDLELVDPAKVDKDSKLATTVQPQRMVIISASFPYRRQSDAYKLALHEPLDKLAVSKDSMPQFLPFNVQRRALDANGKVREPWADLDLVGNYAAAFQYQFGSEAEDPALKDVIFKGLVMSRPQLVRGEYGRPKLAKIDETLGKLLKDKADKPTASVVAPMEKKVKGFNPFGDVAAMEDKEAKTTQSTLKTGGELLVPDHCLVRFIDADEKLKPGMTYQYRLQIRVVNPNYNRPKEDLAYPSLAEDKELTSAWWPKEDSKEVIQVQMAPEFHYYGTELDDKAETEKKKPRSQALYRRQGRGFPAGRTAGWKKCVSIPTLPRRKFRWAIGRSATFRFAVESSLAAPRRSICRSGPRYGSGINWPCRRRRPKRGVL